MKVEIRDRAALAKLSLIDVRAYLTSQAWQQTGRYGDVASIFSRVDERGRDWEILLPLRDSVADFVDRMSEAISILSKVEARSQLEIFSDLVRSGFDVVRFRAASADATGTIALEEGVSLYDEARNLVTAAANAAVKPKRAYRGKSFDEARKYLDDVRLGQTEIGSYVFTVLSPLTPALRADKPQISMFPEADEDPFPRLVTRTLYHSLCAARVAVEEAVATDRIEPFENAVKNGVSANFCEALAKLATGSDGVYISLSWARVRPTSILTTPFNFRQDDSRILQEAARQLKEREPQIDITLEGFVVGLHREPDDFDGRAKIRGNIDGKYRTLNVEFALPDYNKVIRAHDLKLPVRVDGDIAKVGQQFQLLSPRNLMIVEDDAV